ncbi:endonuclease domain-containing protein [bacterium]|nr:endonuclease domain-containing protein [bacterium]MBU1025917.1 endonuclease domain-containing protein [bacterium]
MTSVEKFYKRRKLRKESTIPEQLLWSRLRNRKLGHKFRRQHHVGNYILDFYCVELRLAIEVDGLIHHEIEHQEYDNERSKFISSVGITVIRFDNDEIFINIDSVLSRISCKCDESRKN